MIRYSSKWQLNLLSYNSSTLKQVHCLSRLSIHLREKNKNKNTVITYSSFSNTCIMQVAFYFCLCFADIYKGCGLDQTTMASKYLEFHKQFCPDTKVWCLLFCTYWWIWIIKTLISSEFLLIMRGKEERNLILQNKIFFLNPPKNWQ